MPLGTLIELYLNAQMKSNQSKGGAGKNPANLFYLKRVYKNGLTKELDLIGCGHEEPDKLYRDREARGP